MAFLLSFLISNQTPRRAYVHSSSEERLLMMKSRDNWLMDGDMNTPYFHKSVLVRRKKNIILSLTSEVGEEIHDPSKLSDHIRKYFSSRFTSSFLSSSLDWNPLRLDVLKRGLVLSICGNPVDCEIWEVVSSMGVYKAPSSNGYHPFFYKKLWETIKGDLIPYIQSIFHARKVLSEINETLIAIIPKRDDPSLISQLGPISLCNTVYKKLSQKSLLLD